MLISGYFISQDKQWCEFATSTCTHCSHLTSWYSFVPFANQNIKKIMRFRCFIYHTHVCYWHAKRCSNHRILMLYIVCLHKEKYYLSIDIVIAIKVPSIITKFSTSIGFVFTNLILKFSQLPVFHLLRTMEPGSWRNILILILCNAGTVPCMVL